uniref:Uncharacterized protein n=1 Tax=Oryzias latipes TaxID=8090 RepID=A0A3B3HTH9_ORYLA
MIPDPIIHFCLCGLHLDEVHLNEKKTENQQISNLGVLLAAGSIFALLRFPVGEEDEAVWLSCAEIKGNGSHPLDRI